MADNSIVPTVASVDDVDRVFDTLVSIATEFAGQGRSLRAANIKTALQLRTDPPFDEERYGFANFRAFLRAAAAAGRVDLRPAPVGPDVDVVPKGLGLSTPPTVGGRLRRDIWDAFTRWDEGYERFWDRQEQRAFRIPIVAAPGEADDVADLRASRRSDPARFVVIENIPFATVVAWAREFTESLPPSASRAALLRALEDDLPVRNFTQLVRSLGLGPRWHDAHATKVREVVRVWAARNDLTVDLDLEAGPPAAEVATAQPPHEPGNLLPEPELRRRVHELVDQMTVPELLAIAVPLRLTLTQP